MDYRPLSEDHEEHYQDYTQYSFRIQDGPPDGHDRDLTDEAGDPRGLFDAEELLCVCKHYWFQTRLRDQWLEMPGVAAVASPPEHRRKGYVTRLLAESLAEYRDRGDALTALWPFDQPFYERHGWGVANKFVMYECSPDALSFARDEVETAASEYSTGEFRRVGADDFEILDSVLAEDTPEYELQIDRSAEWWEKRVFENWRGEPYVYVWERDGEPRGYLTYRVSSGDDGNRLDIKEFAAADREARLNLLRFLSNHDSQVETISIYQPHDTSLLDEADDPHEIECNVKPGPMVRLVDVPTAFEQFEYPDVSDAEFTLAVTDSLADWNDQTFRVVVEEGQALCEPIDANSESHTDPDVSTDIATLSQVYVGYHSVEDAEIFGDLEVRDSVARDALGEMFPEKDVYLREAF